MNTSDRETRVSFWFSPRIHFWISRSQIYLSLYVNDANYWFNWYYGNPIRMKKLYWSPDKMVAW